MVGGRKRRTIRRIIAGRLTDEFPSSIRERRANDHCPTQNGSETIRHDWTLTALGARYMVGRNLLGDMSLSGYRQRTTMNRVPWERYLHHILVVLFPSWVFARFRLKSSNGDCVRAVLLIVNVSSNATGNPTKKSFRSIEPSSLICTNDPHFRRIAFDETIRRAGCRDVQ